MAFDLTTLLNSNNITFECSHSNHFRLLNKLAKIHWHIIELPFYVRSIRENNTYVAQLINLYDTLESLSRPIHGTCQENHYLGITFRYLVCI